MIDSAQVTPLSAPKTGLSTVCHATSTTLIR